MKYKIIHLFVELTNLFQSKIVTTKVNKIIIFLFFYYRCDSHATKDFTRFHWIIHDHVIHELYCHISTTVYGKIYDELRRGNMFQRDIYFEQVYFYIITLKLCRVIM
jgi:hypothetical protein